MTVTTVEFWFEFASTYSYPAAMRVGELAAKANARLLWRPFLLGPIFGQQGWNTSPFNIYEAKGRYMWRDLERTCEALGIPFRKPTVFPRNGLLAARVACLNTDESWTPNFVRSVYGANFADDRDISDSAVIEELLAAAGQDAKAVIARAQTPEAKNRLREQTERATSLGIFGAPTVLVGGEMFWGNDRLDDAFRWYGERTKRSSD